MNILITDTDTGRELWTTDQCAAHCGVLRTTWSSYARIPSAPKSVASIGRSPLWDAGEVKAWHAARPGSPVPNAPTAQRKNKPQ